MLIIGLPHQVGNGFSIALHLIGAISELIVRQDMDVNLNAPNNSNPLQKLTNQVTFHYAFDELFQVQPEHKHI